MEENKIKTKKSIVSMIILIVGLIVLIIGTSLAAYNWAYTGNNPNTLSTTGIELKFLESNSEIINITNALPMSDEEGKLEDPFEFSVTSKTTRDTKIQYTLNIEKLSLDSGFSPLNDNQIKVYLTDYDNNQIVAPTLISNLSSYKLYTGVHTHNSSKETVQDKFKLRAWIDESVMNAAQNWTPSTKLQYKFKIGITSSEYNPTYVYRWATNGVYIGDSSSNITGGTSNPSTLNKQHYLKHAIDNNTVLESFVCYSLNSTEYCLKGADPDAYQDNIEILNNSFGSSNCTDYTTYYSCASGGLYARASSNGNVYADDGIRSCNVGGDGSSDCRRGL